MSRLTPLFLILLGLTACAPRAEPIFGTGPNGERSITLQVSNPEIRAEPGVVVSLDIPVDLRTDPECQGL